MAFLLVYVCSLFFQSSVLDLEFLWALANNPQLNIESLSMQIRHEPYKLRCVSLNNRFDRASQSQFVRPKSNPEIGYRLQTSCSHLSGSPPPPLFLKMQLLYGGRHNTFRYNKWVIQGFLAHHQLERILVFHVTFGLLTKLRFLLKLKKWWLQMKCLM